MYVILESAETMTLCSLLKISSGEQLKELLIKLANDTLGYDIPNAENFFHIEWKDAESMLTLQIDSRLLINLYDMLTDGFESIQPNSDTINKSIRDNLQKDIRLIQCHPFINQKWVDDLSKLTMSDIKADNGLTGLSLKVVEYLSIPDIDSTAPYLKLSDLATDAISKVNYEEWYENLVNEIESKAEIRSIYTDLINPDTKYYELLKIANYILKNYENNLGLLKAVAHIAKDFAVFIMGKVYQDKWNHTENISKTVRNLVSFVVIVEGILFQKFYENNYGEYENPPTTSLMIFQANTSILGNGFHHYNQSAIVEEGTSFLTSISLEISFHMFGQYFAYDSYMNQETGLLYMVLRGGVKEC